MLIGSFTRPDGTIVTWAIAPVGRTSRFAVKICLGGLSLTPRIFDTVAECNGCIDSYR